MSTKAISVNIEPSEQLNFHGPFTRLVNELIRVKNPGTEPVIFKVKTTAPKQYCVKPNVGRIEPHSEIEVKIILQPLKEEPAEDFKCKDKFLVEVAPLDPFSEDDITTMWAHVDQGSIQKYKLKCAFVGIKKDDDKLSETQIKPSIPEPFTFTDEITSSATQPKPLQQSHVIATHHTEEPLNQNIASSFNAPAPIAAAAAAAAADTDTTATAAAAPATAKAKVTTTPTASREISQNVPTISPVAPFNTVAPIVETVAPVPVSLENIRKEEDLPARNQTGISSRKLPSTVQPLDAVHQHLAALEQPRPIEGYPPQVVLGVAVLAFLIAYFFF